MKDLFRLIKLCVAATLLAGLSCADSITTYTFTGDCVDCTGQGIGTLVLEDYTLGDELDISNFVYFSYSSNLQAFYIPTDQIHEFSGEFTSLPGPADVFILSDFPAYFTLGTSSDGSWCAGSACLGDYGTSSIWSVANSPSGVPEPAVWVVTLIGLVTMVLVRWRLLSGAEQK